MSSKQKTGCKPAKMGPGLQIPDHRDYHSQHSALSTQHSSPARLGCLPYLNVKPLVYPFEHGNLPEGWDLVYATPSTLARMLADRLIDAAPVSSFACLANPELCIAQGICISSDGPGRTVLMLSKVEPKEVRTVASDNSSLSGRALLKIVLAENYGIEPEFVPCEPQIEKMLLDHDAALIIGNPAMLCDKTGLRVLDLGEEWMKLTGLPAVFAVWAGPNESLTPELAASLLAAKREGAKHIEEIVAEQSPRLGLAPEACEDYLVNVMRYELGAKEIESLRVFGRKSLEHGLIDSIAEISMVEGCEIARNA